MPHLPENSQSWRTPSHQSTWPVPPSVIVAAQPRIVPWPRKQGKQNPKNKWMVSDLNRTKPCLDLFSSLSMHAALAAPQKFAFVLVFTQHRTNTTVYQRGYMSVCSLGSRVRVSHLLSLPLVWSPSFVLSLPHAWANLSPSSIGPSNPKLAFPFYPCNHFDPR